MIMIVAIHHSQDNIIRHCLKPVTRDIATEVTGIIDRIKIAATGGEAAMMTRDLLRKTKVLDLIEEEVTTDTKGDHRFMIDEIAPVDSHHFITHEVQVGISGRKVTMSLLGGKTAINDDLVLTTEKNSILHFFNVQGECQV
jgi:hypothetical protein